MSKLIFIVSLFLVSHSFAENFKSLNQGACYVHEKGSHVKIASFNSYNAYTLDLETVNTLKKKALEIGLKESELESIDTLIHCSSRAKVVFNLKTTRENFCFWAKVSSGKVDFEHVDLALYSNGFCNGVIDDRLIIGFNDGEVDHNFKQIQKLTAMKIKAFKKLRDKVYLIVFDNDKKGSMNVFDLKKSIENEAYVKYVDLNIRQKPSGEAHLLPGLSGKFRK